MAKCRPCGNVWTVEAYRKLVERATPERDWMWQIIHYAQRAGWTYYHETDSRLSEPGLLDLILIRAPRLVWVETKTESGHLTPEQEWWIDALQKCQQEVYIWRPSQWDEVVRVLEHDDDDDAEGEACLPSEPTYGIEQRAGASHVTG